MARSGHDRVDVTIQIHIQRVGTTRCQVSTDQGDQHQPPGRQSVGGQDHCGNGCDEQKLDDARLCERDIRPNNPGQGNWGRTVVREVFTVWARLNRAHADLLCSMS